MNIEDNSGSSVEHIPSSTFDLLREANLLDENIGEVSETTQEFDSGKIIIAEVDE